jgi:hypothetical protein
METVAVVFEDHWKCMWGNAEVLGARILNNWFQATGLMHRKTTVA